MRDPHDVDIPRQEQLTALIWIVVAFTLVMIVLGIVMAIARYVSETAVIRMVDEYEGTRHKMTVRRGLPHRLVAHLLALVPDQFDRQPARHSADAGPARRRHRHFLCGRKRQPGVHGVQRHRHDRVGVHDDLCSRHLEHRPEPAPSFLLACVCPGGSRCAGIAATAVWHWCVRTGRMSV